MPAAADRRAGTPTLRIPFTRLPGPDDRKANISPRIQLVPKSVTDNVDVVIAGAGLVGLSIAKALAAAGREVMVLEAESSIGTGMSSRNSEVIHAGIYYPAGSLKARLCVEGRALLYDYCQARNIGHNRIGKLIVAATAEEAETLEVIRQGAITNGVEDLIPLSRAQATELEPALQAVAALWSPSTGIVDSHALMLAYQGDAEAAGTIVVFHAPVLGGRIMTRGVALEIGGSEPLRLTCNLFVNCAGLDATKIAARIEGLPAAAIPALHPCKGSYFSLSMRSPFRHLIYPVPEPGGLGTHLTLDLGGQARFGPDVEWADSLDYRVDPARAARFYPAIRRYWPDLPDNALLPAYSGIRAKLSGPGEPAADFRIDGPLQHGIPGIINLFGIESPGLTASLAIARHVLRMADDTA